MADVWDVAIVGAGPAGSLAAVSALRTSPHARVVLLDRDAFPRDKVCGDALGPRCFDALDRFNLGGVVDDYRVAGEMVLASRVYHAQHPLRGPFRVVPRRVFDSRLVVAAVAAGAVLQRRQVRRLDIGRDVVTIDTEMAARVVIGADGAESVVRRQVGVKPNPEGRVGVAIRGYAPTASDAPRIVSQGSNWPAYAWEFPIGNGTSNVGYIDVPRRGRTVTRASLLDAASDLLPDVVPHATAWRAHRLPLSAFRSSLPDGRVLLAGDAASLVNPCSGEGIRDALLSGSLAGEVALLGRQAGRAYQARISQALGRHQRHTAAAAQLCRVTPLAALGLRMAEVDGPFFDTVLDLALGDGAIRPLVSARALARVMARSLPPTIREASWPRHPGAS